MLAVSTAIFTSVLCETTQEIEKESMGSFLKGLVVKVLNIAILTLSPAVVLVQVWKCHSSGKAEGLSFQSFVFNALALLNSIGYSYHNGYPIGSYGEAIPLYLGTILI